MLNTYSQKLLAGSFLILGLKFLSSGGKCAQFVPKAIFSAIEPFKKNSVYAIQLATTDLSFKVVSHSGYKLPECM